MSTPAPGHIRRADPNWLARKGLHLHGQQVWHDDVYIVGSPDVLRGLVMAILAAIESGRGEVEVFANDGEGYSVRILAEALTDAHAVPYEDPMAREHRVDARWPDDAWHLEPPTGRPGGGPPAPAPSHPPTTVGLAPFARALVAAIGALRRRYDS